MKLGVNIDHVATLRQARGTSYPDPLDAAIICARAGADNITAHLREDRRHIQDDDIYRIKNLQSLPLNLEMANSESILQIALEVSPSEVCIVPEKRQELTTEGGLNIKYNFNFLKEMLPNLYKNNIEVSLFLDPDIQNIGVCKELGINAVEFHTGEIANAFGEEEKFLINKLKNVIEYTATLGISIRAGHGLNFDKTKKIINIKYLEELNIGHFIIGESIFYGLSEVVKKMKKIIG